MTVGTDTDFLVRLAILEHREHQTTKELRDWHLDRGHRFGLAPQVLSEFTHVVSDPRRFENPVPMEKALQMARNWWNAAEVDQILPSSAAISKFFDLMEEHRLGRKRILDTMLAATYLSVGVTQLITGNSADYRFFSELQLIEM